jgi:hypothetical protein
LVNTNPDSRAIPPATNTGPMTGKPVSCMPHPWIGAVMPSRCARGPATIDTAMNVTNSSDRAMEALSCKREFCGEPGSVAADHNLADVPAINEVPVRFLRFRKLEHAVDDRSQPMN